MFARNKDGAEPDLGRALSAIVAIGLCLTLVPVSAMAAGVKNSEINVGQGLTFSSTKGEAPAPLAIHGYDAVSYFTNGEARLGSSARAANYKGAIYWFASNRHLRMFKKTPSKFAPQYGGFCAFGVTQQTKFDGDPKLWTVHAGKLYLNVTPQIQAMFKKNVAGNIASADRLWPKIKGKAAGPLFRTWAAKQKN